MNVHELISYVESPEFVSKVGLASGEHVFLSILADDDCYKELRKLLQSDISCLRTVLSRIKRLVGLGYDQRYENPYDVPLAVFALAANVVPAFGEIAADLVGNARNVWWASRAVELIHRAREQSTQSNASEIKVVFAPSTMEVQTGAQVTEINLGLMQALQEINIVPVSSLHSSSSATSLVSQFSPASNNAMRISTEGQSTSETEVRFAAAA